MTGRECICLKPDGIFKKVDSFLEYLDPSLFQTIILGILAIFMPFLIKSYANISDKDDDFDKIIFNKNILQVSYLFSLSIPSIFLFAFFSGTDVNVCLKILLIFAALYLIIVFCKMLKEVIKFSIGERGELEFLFLDSSDFSKIKSKEHRQATEAWISFWHKEIIPNELEITKLFISKIKFSINAKISTGLSALLKGYSKNIKNRSTDSIHKILLESLNWNKESLEGQRKYGNLNCWALFGRELFKSSITKLVSRNDKIEYLFSRLEGHIGEVEKKLISLESEGKSKLPEDEKERREYFIYMKNFFDVLFPILSADHRMEYEFWKYYFPPTWTVEIGNKDNFSSCFILNYFEEYYKTQRADLENKDKFNVNLSNIIEGIFPDVHSRTFIAFLHLKFSATVAEAMESKENFHVSSYFVSPVFVSNLESEKKIHSRRDEADQKRDESERQKTIQMILAYFICRDSKMRFFTSDYYKKLKISLEERKKNIKIDLENVKSKIGDVIIDKKSSSEKKENKEFFLAMIDSLIEELSKSQQK